MVDKFILVRSALQELFAATSGFLRQAVMVYPQVQSAGRVFEYGANTALAAATAAPKALANPVNSLQAE